MGCAISGISGRNAAAVAFTKTIAPLHAERSRCIRNLHSQNCDSYAKAMAFKRKIISENLKKLPKKMGCARS